MRIPHRVDYCVCRVVVMKCWIEACLVLLVECAEVVEQQEGNLEPSGSQSEEVKTEAVFESGQEIKLTNNKYPALCFLDRKHLQHLPLLSSTLLFYFTYESQRARE